MCGLVCVSCVQLQAAREVIRVRLRFHSTGTRYFRRRPSGSGPQPALGKTIRQKIAGAASSELLDEVRERLAVLPG